MPVLDTPKGLDVCAPNGFDVVFDEPPKGLEPNGDCVLFEREFPVRSNGKFINGFAAYVAGCSNFSLVVTCVYLAGFLVSFFKKSTQFFISCVLIFIIFS